MHTQTTIVGGTTQYIREFVTNIKFLTLRAYTYVKKVEIFLNEIF